MIADTIRLGVRHHPLRCPRTLSDCLASQSGRFPVKGRRLCLEKWGEALGGCPGCLGRLVG